MQRQLLTRLRRAHACLEGPGVQGGRAEASFPPTGEAADEAMRLAARLAARTGAPVGSPLEGPEGDPLLRVACPLSIEGQARGAIVVEVAAEPGQQGAVVRLLEWGEGWLRLILAAGAATTPAASLAALLGDEEAPPDYPALLHRILTGLPALLGCDQVALSLAEDAGVYLEGVSGVPEIDRRGSTARRLQAAMQEARTLAAPVTVRRDADADADAGPPAHRELLAETGAGAVNSLLVPVGQGAGWLFTLLMPPGTDPEVVLRQARPLLQAAAPLLALRYEQARPWAWRCGRLLREAARRLVTPHRRRALQWAAGLGLVGYLMLPAEYRVSAEAVLEPVSQQSLVAPFDSFVVEAPVRAGETVAEAQLLARLDDREPNNRAQALAAELRELDRKRRQAVSRGEAGEARVLEARYKQAAARLALARSQLQQTEIRAPVAGVVIAGDWQRRIGAPVSRGDTLFEIAPLDAYRVVLRVRDRDIAALRAGQSGELVLSALPDRALPLRVTDIVTIAESEAREPLFRVEAELLRPVSELRPGMQGLAKVQAGERARWWVWTHGLWDWLWLHLWRWLP